MQAQENKELFEKYIETNADPHWPTFIEEKYSVSENPGAFFETDILDLILDQCNLFFEDEDYAPIPTEGKGGVELDVLTAFNEHRAGIAEEARKELTAMKTEKEVREGIAAWSPEKRWIAQSDIAAAIEKGRSPEHNVAVLDRVRE